MDYLSYFRLGYEKSAEKQTCWAQKYDKQNIHSFVDLADHKFINLTSWYGRLVYPRKNIDPQNIIAVQ
jgi:hypothetical protein